MIRHRAFCVFSSLRCDVCLCDPTQSVLRVFIITMRDLTEIVSRVFIITLHGLSLSLHHNTLLVFPLLLRCEVCLRNPRDRAFCVPSSRCKISLRKSNSRGNFCPSSVDAPTCWTAGAREREGVGGESRRNACC